MAVAVIKSPPATPRRGRSLTLTGRGAQSESKHSDREKSAARYLWVPSWGSMEEWAGLRGISNGFRIDRPRSGGVPEIIDRGGFATDAMTFPART